MKHKEGARKAFGLQGMFADNCALPFTVENWVQVKRAKLRAKLLVLFCWNMVIFFDRNQKSILNLTNSCWMILHTSYIPQPFNYTIDVHVIKIHCTVISAWLVTLK